MPKDELFAGWAALKAACRASHKSGAGGAAVCVCGAAGGSSPACGMLGLLRDLVRFLPADSLPDEWREHLARLRAATH